MIRFNRRYETYRPSGVCVRIFEKGEETELPAEDEGVLLRKGVAVRPGDGKEDSTEAKKISGVTRMKKEELELVAIDKGFSAEDVSDMSRKDLIELLK